ncbi:MAG: amidase family protein, partial [Geminicoccaceae bacterium]|nr:amidase family protein [Geminicoccaceae bacterium]
AFLDPEHARRQARTLDDFRKRGLPIGPLHGLPVGVKDIVDTKDFGTENGTVLHAGRRPKKDATIVRRLRSAGAVVLGKTVTTELAAYAPGKTRNPHDPAHTPGGSSSGSAAAVADGMVPLAIGTQTNGSVIRPAAFCGVYGFKPSHGLIPRTGVLAQSRPLDTIGTMAAHLEDTALLAEVLAGADGRDPDVPDTAAPRLLEVLDEPPPVTPRLAFVKTPVFDQADEETVAAFSELTGALGERVEEVELPAAFERAHDFQRTLMEADFARSFHELYERGADRLSGVLRGQIERGRTLLAVDYNRAIDAIGIYNGVLDELFDRYDAVLTPAAPGAAPRGLEATGSPTFCTIWTLCGTPAITLPLLQNDAGLPIGVQLVGRKGEDGRLLRTARWLVETLAAESALAGSAGTS